MEIQETVEELLAAGLAAGTADIYFLPRSDTCEISFRGQREKKCWKKLDLAAGEKLIRHFKFLAAMDIGEKRKPQTGAATLYVHEETVRLRLSSVGDFQGKESLVIRILPTEASGAKKASYFFQEQLSFIESALGRRGLFVFAGPVGSGKTTTMYHLARKKFYGRQVIAIEDPVEIEEPAFLQLQTNEKIQMDYEELIKACLRHRPDCLILGEIRDAETAKMAVRAALTGHTVLATVHSGELAGIPARLRELGVSQSEIEECIKGMIFQRLLPVAFEHGKEAVLFDLYLPERGDLHSSWNQSLKKCWSVGFIETKILQEEKIIESQSGAVPPIFHERAAEKRLFDQ
ncbi:competence type IV pilus ATPase ComGA [Enterococcus hirae]|nr:competence type IV pilus ATPase ComGA [Enterococcus hirae]